MEKLIFLLLSFSLVQSAYSQQNHMVTAANTLSSIGAPNKHYTPPILTKDNTVNVEDAFFLDDWHTGYAILDDSVKSNVMPMAYSLHTNELLVTEKERKYTFPAKYLRGFVFTGTEKRTVFKNGFQSKKYEIPKDQMMRVIYNGKTKLLAKESSEWGYRNGGALGQLRFQFFPKTTFFLIKDSKFNKIKLQKEDILSVLNENKEKLERFALQNNLKFDNETSLIKILAQYEKNQSE